MCNTIKHAQTVSEDPIGASRSVFSCILILYYPYLFKSGASLDYSDNPSEIKNGKLLLQIALFSTKWKGQDATSGRQKTIYCHSAF